MSYPNLERYLQSFGKYIVTQSRANLTRGTKKYGSKNNTKQLYNSIRYEVQETIKGLSIKFFMLEYGEAVDKGVDGVKSYLKTPDAYIVTDECSEKILDIYRKDNDKELIKEIEICISTEEK